MQTRDNVERPGVCAECHHLPSDRTADYGATCFCRCHDLADAAPALYEAAKAALSGVICRNDPADELLERVLRAALALVDGPETTP